jgi:hypothetical protein
VRECRKQPRKTSFPTDGRTQSWCRLFKTCWKNDKFNYMSFLRKMSEHFQQVICTSSRSWIHNVGTLSKRCLLN